MLPLTYLYIGLEREADDEKADDGVDVVLEGGPVVDPEGGHERSHQHEEDGARTEDRTGHQERLKNTDPPFHDQTGQGNSLNSKCNYYSSTLFHNPINTDIHGLYFYDIS